MHRLEAPLQRRVALDVRPVLVERRGADALEVPAGQCWLQQVGRIDANAAIRVPRAAGSNKHVHLINDEDHAPAAVANLPDHVLQPLLEVPAVAGASEKHGEVQLHHTSAAQHLGHIAVSDTLCQAVSNGGLAHARFTDEHRVVLRAPTQDADGTAQLLLAAHQGVQLRPPGQQGQVLAKPQRRCKLCVFYGLVANGARLARPHFAPL
mmetsp:Transcript_68116/g.211621  ORF Transcript_68116/g.211621 Transcript_68116/m.211621 type:complete len:208 (-) Transcript_68116:448-1071(-)